MTTGSRNVTRKDLFGIGLVVVFLFGGLFVAHFYSKPIGLAMMGTLIAICVVGWANTPKAQKKAIFHAAERQEKTSFGRIMNVISWMLWGFVAVILLAVALNAFKGLGP